MELCPLGQEPSSWLCLDPTSFLLSGPPESMREHVVAASKAMKMGDWKTCHSFIINEKMNGKVWDLFPEADKVRTMLVR